MSAEKIPLWLSRLIAGNKQRVNYDFEGGTTPRLDSAISGDDMNWHWAKSLSQKDAYKWKPYDPEQALSLDNYPSIDPSHQQDLYLNFLHERHLREQGTSAKGLDAAQLEQAHLDYENQLRLNTKEYYQKLEDQGSGARQLSQPNYNFKKNESMLDNPGLEPTVNPGDGYDSIEEWKKAVLAGVDKQWMPNLKGVLSGAQSAPTNMATQVDSPRVSRKRGTGGWI